jgi:hypothetical protein
MPWPSSTTDVVKGKGTSAGPALVPSSRRRRRSSSRRRGTLMAGSSDSTSTTSGDGT